MDEVKASAIGTFRKRPVVISAVQLGWDTWSEVCDLLGADAFANGAKGVYFLDDKVHDDFPGEGAKLGVVIPTLEGKMLGREGDWIIRGVAGECYPCKPEIFEATYEAVDG